MASSDKDVEEQLLEAGNKIIDPPTSLEELLSILDIIESLLKKVEQSPSKSMQSALAPSLKALVSDKLLRHSDIDVKVAVAACISEITRISAPDAPYSDDQMKEVFHLIVSSFENLYDKSSRSYAKRESILETVAKVRSCVVMLDLECDRLIIEMFQHFLKTVRDYHPENVFSSMKTIMSLVFEESEDISVELLSPILDSVKKDNEEILPISRKLGERVLDNCSTKLKPYLVQAVRTLGISFNDYSDVVASICKDHSGSHEPSNLHDVGENMVEEKPTEVATPERIDIAIEKHHGSVKSNGVAQEGEDGSVSNLENKKEEQGGQECNEVKSPKSSEPANLGYEKASNVKERSEKAPRKRGRKTNQSSKSTEALHVDAQKGSESQPEGHREHPGSPHGDRSAENMFSTNEVDAKPSSPKAMEIDSIDAVSPSLSGSILDQCNNKSGQGNKAGQARKKGKSAKEVASSEVSKKSSDGMNDSRAKVDSHAEEEAPAGVSDDTKIASEDAAERESDTNSDFEVKTLKQSTRKGDGASKSVGGSLKQSEAKRKKGPGKSISGTKKSSVGMNDSGAKVDSHAEDEAPAGVSDDTKTASEDATERESDTNSDSEAKTLKQSTRKGDGASKSGDGSLKQSEAKRKKGPRKSISGTKKSSVGMNDSGAKVDSHAEDEAPAGVSDDTKSEDAIERESDTNSDSEAKTLKQSSRKGDGASKSGVGSLKQSEAKRKKGSGKSISGKTVKKLSGDDDKKETTPVLKPASKTAKDEKILCKTTPPASKRKRTPGKEKESEAIDLDETLVGSKIQVWWPKDRMFYSGVVDSFDPEKRKHKVLYTDGDEEILNLKKEKWEFIDDDSESEQEQTPDLVRSESAAETPQKKKAKLNTNESAKRGKMDGSPKKGGVTSSSKSKGAATKTDRSSGSKVEGKLKENTPKLGRPPNATGSKSKGQTTPKTGGKAGSAGPKIGGKSKNDDAAAESHKTGKSKDDETSTLAASSKSKQDKSKSDEKSTPAAASAKSKQDKSMNDETSTPAAASAKSKQDKSKNDETTSTPAASAKSKQDASKMGKSKQETPKSPAISKGKSPKTGDKSNNSNLSPKVKFTSSKSKESGDLKNSSASGKTTENSKGKSINSSNDQGNASKSGKKRRRESKG